MRIDSYQLSVVVGVTIARARASGLYVTEHRAGIAADGVVSHAWPQYRRSVLLRVWLRGCGQVSRGRGACGPRWRGESRSGSPARSESLPARRFLLLRMARSARDLQSESTRLRECRRLMESDSRAGSRLCRERTPPSAPCQVPERRRLQSGPQSESD